MQCTVCHKSIATIHILDLKSGSVSEEKNLCARCAENAGYVHPKTTPLTISTEILEDLIVDLKGGKSKAAGAEAEAEAEAEADAVVDPSEPHCPGCNLTQTRFRARGRLGCPRCYEFFRKNLLPLLERVHDATSHRGRYPAGTTTPEQPKNNTVILRRLQKAVQNEDYELAAQLRDEIRQLKEKQGGSNS